MICLLARGHCLIEGVPGLAKTLTVSTLADVVGGSFARIQFTPDLVPADIVGTRVLASVARRVRHRVGSRLRQPRARRRDQPCARQGAVRVARSHGRAPGVDRRSDEAVAEAVPRARDAEPDRVRRRVRASRSAARPLHDADRRAATVVRRRDRDRPPHGRDTARSQAVCSPSSNSRRCRPSSTRSSCTTRCSDYAVRLVMATRDPRRGAFPNSHRTSRSAPARVQRSVCCRRAVRSHCCEAAAT